MIVRTLPHATRRITRRSLYVRRTDYHNQPTRFPIILFNPWITVTLSLGCQVFAHFLFYVITHFIFAWVSALFSSPFPPRKAWYSNYFIFTQRFRAKKCLSKSIKFSGILPILILVVSFVYTWTRRNFRLSEAIRQNALEESRGKWTKRIKGDHFFLYLRVQKLCSRSSEDLSWPVGKFLRRFILEIARFVPSIFSQNYKKCLPCECW